MPGRRAVRRSARFARIAVVALLSACASSTTAPPRPKPGTPLAPKAFFWEATAPNGAKLYLLGSVHIGDGRELILDERIEKDWNESQELVVELDATSTSDIDAVDATTRFGLLPKGTKLQDVVKPDTYKQVAKYMKQHDYDITRVDRMRPWLVAQIITQLEYTAAGLDAENGVDMVLMRRAVGRKGIVPLETLDGQAALFAGLPAALQETMLVEILRESKALLAVTRATLSAWEEGDESTLSGLLFAGASSDAQLAQFYEQVFYARNRAMTDRLVALTADTHPRFVVVGTGHLIGTQGIPALLAQRSFQLERFGSARVVPGTVAGGKAMPAELPPPTPTAAPIAPVGQPAPAQPAVAKPVAPAPAAPAASAPTPVAPVTPAATAAQPSPTASAPMAPAPATPALAPAPEVAAPAPVPAPAQTATPRPAAVSAPTQAATPQPAPVPAAAQTAAPPSTAAPASTQAATSQPAPARKPNAAGDQYDAWLGQDASSAASTAEPAHPPVAAPAAVEPAPAGAAAAAPQPAPASPKPASRRLSRPK